MVIVLEVLCCPFASCFLACPVLDDSCRQVELFYSRQAQQCHDRVSRLDPCLGDQNLPCFLVVELARRKLVPISA